MSKTKQKRNNIPFITFILIGINIVIFLWNFLYDGLSYKEGMLSLQDFIQNKEYYQIVTSLFFHGDTKHLVNNMLLLAGLGFMMEKELGHFSFLVTYFVTGIGGNMVSLVYKYIMDQWNVGSIGASGCIFGLTGVLLTLALFSGQKMQNATPLRILFILAYSLYCSFGDKTIDNAAHIGGLLFGMVIGIVLSVLIRKAQRNSFYNLETCGLANESF